MLKTIEIRKVKIPIFSKVADDRDEVEALAFSITENGLLQMICLTPKGSLVFGHRRLKALKAAGVKTLLLHTHYTLCNGDDLKQEMDHIHSNILSRVLNPVDYDEAVLRSKELYEELHPSTKHGKKDAKVAPFHKSMSKATGISPRKVQAAAQRASKSSDKVKEMRKENKLTTAAVTELCKLSPPHQDKVLPFVLNRSKAQASDIVAKFQKGKDIRTIRLLARNFDTEYEEGLLPGIQRKCETLNKMILVAIDKKVVCLQWDQDEIRNFQDSVHSLSRTLGKFKQKQSQPMEASA